MRQPLIERLQACNSMPPLLECLLDASLQATGAPLGNIQLMNWRAGCLELAAQRGFGADFVKFFQRVRAGDGSACALALRQRREIVVEDVSTFRAFSPLGRETVLGANVRAVQSMPMISRNGAFLGIVSVHFPMVHRPLAGETEVIRELVDAAANVIIRLRARQSDGSDAFRKAAEAITTSHELLLRLTKSSPPS